MDTTQFRKLDHTYVLNVLYQIRAEIVREELDGLEHVDWLIRARGADPEARLIRKLRPRRFKRNELSRAVLRALRDGPKTTAEITALVGNHPGTRDSVTSALARLRKRGLVVVVSPARGGIRQVWELA